MKNIIKGTPEQFMQAVKDKISELGGRDTISQSVDIQAAASPLSPSGELTSVISTLIENVGSRLGDTPAYLCNLGEGGTIVIYEDDNAGDVCGMTDSQMFYGADSVIDAVLSSWGKATPVESAENIQATTYRDYNGIMGDPGSTWTTKDLKDYWKSNHDSDPVLDEYESMQSWLDDTIAMLHPVDIVESATNTDSNEERYIHSLIGELETRLEEALSEDTEIVVDSVLFDTDNRNLYVTVAYDGNVHEYTVPYADLKFDWEDMQSDTSYVVNEIVSDVSAQPNK